MGVINYDINTKTAHSQFVNWLNTLVQSYVTGFWDNSIKAMVELSFITSTTVFMQELYTNQGRTYAGFLVVTDLQSEGFQLLIFDQNGSPYAYSDTGVSTIFNVVDGKLSSFTTDTVLDVNVSNGNVGYSLIIEFEDLYGIKAPLCKLRTTDGNVLQTGFIDLEYKGKYRPTYSVITSPVDEIPKYIVSNYNNESVIDIRVPILSGYSVEYKIPPTGAVLVPITSTSTEYLNRIKGNLTINFRKNL